jgi:hypothetical protein
MMGHKEKLKTIAEFETVHRDQYHGHTFHEIKKSMSRRYRRQSKQNIKNELQ